MTRISLCPVIMILVAGSGCTAELGDPDDPAQRPPESAGDDASSESPEDRAPPLGIAALNLYESGVINLSGGIGGKSQNRIVSAPCPGFQRTFLEAIKLSSGGTCNIVDWVSQDPTDCRIIVHVGVGSFGNVSCAWNVYADKEHGYSFNVSNTNSAQQNTLDTRIPLNEGNTIDVGTCGVPGGSASGDTYVRLLGPSNQLVALNDDACASLASHVTYTVPAGGTGMYTVKAGCFSSGSCSGVVDWEIH